MSQRTLREATVTINAGGTNTATLKIGEGNITFSQKRPVEIVRDRGEIETARLADDEPIDVSFDFIWEWILSGTLANPYEIITQTGSASAFTGTNSDCEPYAVDIIIDFSGACGETTEKIHLKRFMYESIDFDLRAGQISCSGRCLDNSIGDNVTASPA